MNGRRTPETNNSKANKGSPLLSEEVPYQITLIICSRGGLDRTQEGGESHLGDVHGE